jgi:N-acetylmuramoyl-L-alanine amidase
VPFDRVAYHCGAGQPAGPDGRFYTPLARQRWPECTADPARDSPNRLLLGIEFCHPDASGQPTPETRAALVWLLAGLCRRYGLSPGNDLFRHQDIVGYKECPRWYCRQPREWEALLADVAQAPEAWP